MNTLGYFEIQSNDPPREVEFYKNVFGWKFTKDESLPIEYYRLETSNMNGGLLKRPAPIVPMSGTNAFTCSIQVENFEKTEELILKNGGQTSMPKFAIPGRCWQGYYCDADMNVFGIYQADVNAK